MYSFFYVDDELLMSTWIEWLQWEFDDLMVIFDRVGLWINAQKKIGMV